MTREFGVRANATFARVRAFEWNEGKRASNLRNHRIDFEDARRVIGDPTFVRESSRNGETRYMVFGFVEKREVVIVCTIRGETCRLISARRARRDERKKYYSRLPRRSPAEGQD